MEDKVAVPPVRQEANAIGRMLAKMRRWLIGRATNQTGTLRHNFAITHLGQAEGWFQPHCYRYFCVRCRWDFRVESRRGYVVAIGPDNLPIKGEEGRLRVATFVSGPCPGVPGQSAFALQLIPDREPRRLPVRIAVQSNTTIGRRKAR